MDVASRCRSPGRSAVSSRQSTCAGLGLPRPTTSRWRRRNGDMGLALLKDVLSDWSKYELDDSIYVPAGSVASLDLQVNVLPFDPLRKRVFESQEHWLGIEQGR